MPGEGAREKFECTQTGKDDTSLVDVVFVERVGVASLRGAPVGLGQHGLLRRVRITAVRGVAHRHRVHAGSDFPAPERGREQGGAELPRVASRND